ncbi:hypothetical protein PMI12_02121 [Variovorax sp. CF313]|uniref:hypothetical protein n=1 Tax=Variovorax sp. CF313 TaxID=1144315 RepID=UPI0002713E3D|nr:hypothetical protein [Variovorax sp. CF313]EJL76658.1 hypothetical protein PMI12_02121 [Variovorax sp. CF313]
MLTDGFSLWWILVPILLWLLLSLVVTLLRSWRKHVEETGREQRAVAVLATGVPALAQVVAVRDTGVRRAARGAVWAIVTLQLRVQATATTAAFDAQATSAISIVEIPDYVPGKTIRVKVDRGSLALVVERRPGTAAYYRTDDSQPGAAANEAFS